MRFALIILAIAVLCAPAAASDLIPTVTNPGFEAQTAGWGWQVMGGAQASYEVTTVYPHSGKYCMAFNNNSGIGANVYGRMATGVNVIPSTKYELSCWVRGVDVADGAGSSHMTDWQSYTLDVPDRHIRLAEDLDRANDESRPARHQHRNQPHQQVQATRD